MSDRGRTGRYTVNSTSELHLNFGGTRGHGLNPSIHNRHSEIPLAVAAVGWSDELGGTFTTGDGRTRVNT